MIARGGDAAVACNRARAARVLDSRERVHSLLNVLPNAELVDGNDAHHQCLII